MGKKLSVTNLSDRQWDWIKEKAELSSVAKAAIVKMLIQDAITREEAKTNAKS